MKPSLSERWQKTPWGHLWAAAMIVMIGAFVGALVDGFGLGKAIIFAILCGPGFLAVATVLGVILSYFSPRSD